MRSLNDHQNVPDPSARMAAMLPQLQTGAATTKPPAAKTGVRADEAAGDLCRHLTGQSRRR